MRTRLLSTVVACAWVFLGAQLSRAVEAILASSDCIRTTAVNTSTWNFTCVDTECDSVHERCSARFTRPTLDPKYGHCKCGDGSYLPDGEPGSTTICHLYTKTTAGLTTIHCTVGNCPTEQTCEQRASGAWASCECDT